MPNIDFKVHETLFMDMQRMFNSVLEREYPDALEYSHIQLYEITGVGSPEDWKRFKTDPRVAEWYNNEMTLIARQKIFKLLNKTGDSTSTAQTQALGQLLNFLKSSEEAGESNKYFIYSFIPLTRNEEAAENVKILDFIPNEIAGAIQSFKPKGTK